MINDSTVPDTVNGECSWCAEYGELYDIGYPDKVCIRCAFDYWTWIFSDIWMDEDLDKEFAYDDMEEVFSTRHVQTSPLIFAIDFDGTIVCDKYPCIGELVPQAAECIRELKRMGHTVIIWTCREGTDRERMVKFLDDHNIPYDRINEHAPEMIQRYGGDARKVYAHCYVDDRGIGNWTWTMVLEKARQGAC